MEVPVSPALKFTLRKSAAVSPTVVHKTLMIQKYSVISGTLFSIIASDLFMADN
jgi:hypothetical protein